MNYAEFKEKFREALQNHFLGRGQVYYDLVRKTNDTDKEAVVVWRFGATVRPMIYLEDMYEGYRQTGDFEKCVKETIRACETIPFIKESRLPKTWESVKCRVHMRVINKNWNQEALKQMSYREYLDLAIVFYVFIKEERGLVATLPVNRDCMELWDVDMKTLWEAAQKNLREETFQVETMESALENALEEMADQKAAGIFQNDMEGMEEEGIGMAYVVTNPCRRYAARAILRKDLLQESAKELGGSFYILPCSVHEIILLKETRMITEENLKNMVYEINHCSGAVEPEEWLSDSIYYYNKDKGRVVLVA